MNAYSYGIFLCLCGFLLSKLTATLGSSKSSVFTIFVLFLPPQHKNHRGISRTALTNRESVYRCYFCICLCWFLSTKLTAAVESSKSRVLFFFYPDCNMNTEGSRHRAFLLFVLSYKNVQLACLAEHQRIIHIYIYFEGVRIARGHCIERCVMGVIKVYFAYIPRDSCTTK